MGFTYLEAAREVLRRQGGAMHYDAIGLAAVNLGLLETESRDPAKQMGVTLCQDVQRRRGSDFRRVRPGVFELAEHSNQSTPLGRYECLGARINDLCRRLQLAGHDAVLRRALWILRICLEIEGESNELEVGERRLTLNPDGLCREAMSNWKHRDNGRDDDSLVELSRSLSREYNGVARSLGTNLPKAVASSVSVLEILLELTDGRRVSLTGQGGMTETVWIR